MKWVYNLINGFENDGCLVSHSPSRNGNWQATVPSHAHPNHTYVLDGFIIKEHAFDAADNFRKFIKVNGL